MKVKKLLKVISSNTNIVFWDKYGEKEKLHVFPYKGKKDIESMSWANWNFIRDLNTHIYKAQLHHEIHFSILILSFVYFLK